ncbi:hypothetical protein [Leptothoe sp. PORK10 BA2]|uniref:hypothetical protein n=1 Tax=Leptothoe sp. PORK10 BA2 TaxID=3110254 RepID=UPI002B209412|nr:hypothetical protein [Leptothoe sp. PORK10 BA2]MEA5466077.1 hypothetical protein [Leptothoe sp. PORK10 BA2]
MKIDTETLSFSDFTPSDTPLLGQTADMMATPVIAQQFENNFFDHSGEILGNFVESGQVWALLIGIVLGYAIRGITTY